jgi:alpha-tubulin suppressor-like RCC1 family protein
LINVRALLWRGSLLALVVAAAFVASPDHPVSAATVALSVGSSHTCAVTTSGGLKCWGENSHGQLGDGTTTDSSTPVAVSGLGSGVAVVSVGSSHSCVLTTAGAVKCWGENSDGRLGDGTTTDRSTPVSVSGLTVGVVAVSVGSFHACALTKAGGVKCWGRNSDGRLGDETTTDRNRPVEASGLSSSVLVEHGYRRPGSAGAVAPGLGVAAVSAGASHTCALTNEGAVICWGDNSHGQLGDGTGGPDVFSAAPVGVKELVSGAAAVSTGGYHTCALITEGPLKCWGDNTNGQLGDGTGGPGVFSATPVDVTGLAKDIAGMSAGQRHTCATTTAGAVKCWGSDGTGTQDAGGSRADRTVPVDVAGLTSGVAAVSSGDQHTCAMTTGGDVRCWGDNSKGQLGDGTIIGGPTPVAVVGLHETSPAKGAQGGDVASVTGAAQGSNMAYVIGAAAGAVIILIGGGWYARRRWLRKPS